MKKQLAVIMSIYKNDQLKYIKLAIESILNQTYEDFDFYIQYDGPIRADIANYMNNLNDPRVIISKREENKGLAFSLNELLSIVMPLGYEYIARMDADDISELNRFEKQLLFYDKHPDVECLGTWAIEITQTGEEYFKKQMPLSHDECKALFHKRDCMIHPTVMFRRSFIEKAGFYALDTFYGEDTMMWAQGFAAGCIFANVPEYLLSFRIDEHFFERRRGWKYAKGIINLRCKVNKMLGFGMVDYFWAIAYGGVKMMPTPILNILYKIAR